MTLYEKAALLSGTDFMYTNPIPRLQIPGINVSDGPHGLRKQASDAKDNGVSESEPATSFPTAATTASSWNPENVYRMGKAIATECSNYHVDILLGPGVNIKRNPLCGRNFEYFSEDPLLSGIMGAAEVKGIQEHGIGVSVKHFALNNSENFRFMGDSVADERAIREIYLMPFERVVKTAAPETMMCAYNKINGIYCCQNSWLLTNVLRKEWGFNGVVMSDWGATHERAKGVDSGLDLEMPGDSAISRKWIVEAAENGTLTEEKLNSAVENMLKLVVARTEKKNMQQTGLGGLSDETRDAHHMLASEIAADSAVLMKNEGMLPLNRKDSFLVVGELFDKMRYQGSGSSMISPARVCTPKDAFEQSEVNYKYVKGYRENSTLVDQKLELEAIAEAKRSKKVLFFAGLTDYVESEGVDREHMKLPDNQTRLLDQLTLLNVEITVILFGGSSVELPFEKKVNAILNMYLPGQNGGQATADLLFGVKNPSGRLAETWVMNYEDVPFGNLFGKKAIEVYKESIFVGYRYYQTAGIPVRYPFGHGLSYTDFKYSNMKYVLEENELVVTGTLCNTGSYDGAEVVQCYVSVLNSKLWRPNRELKAFQKIFLRKGEVEDFELRIPQKDLEVFWDDKKVYVLENGTYEIQICKDVNTLIWTDSVEIKGEVLQNYQPVDVNRVYNGVHLELVTDSIFESMSKNRIPKEIPTLPITLESRFTDLKKTFMGRILFHFVISVAKNSEKRARKLPEGTERDNRIKGAIFLKRVLESNSLMTMCMTGGKTFPYHLACGFVEMANGHILKGIFKMCNPPKVEKLPKDIKTS